LDEIAEVVKNIKNPAEQYACNSYIAAQREKLLR